MESPIPIGGSRAEVRASMRPFLRDIFMALDEQSTLEIREEAFDFSNRLFFKFSVLYTGTMASILNYIKRIICVFKMLLKIF